MKSRKNNAPNTDKPGHEGGCTINIRIKSSGTINIYNCSASPPPEAPCAPPGGEHPCLPGVPGACVPVSLGAKPKQSRRNKLDRLLANNRVPSTLGASFFHLMRRFLAGKGPANALEESGFATLRRLPPELKRVLACAGDSLDSLSGGERSRLLATGLLPSIDQPIDLAQLSLGFAQEIADRVGVQAFDDAACATREHPGRVRVRPYIPGEENFDPLVRICRVNGLRTGSYTPPLSPGEYLPSELQQRCRVIMEGNEARQVCEVQTVDCPGNSAAGACQRVLEIEAGQGVLLEGVNFSSVDATVRLFAKDAPGTVLREVPAQVCGDDETPLTERIGNQDRLILDCRVHDRLSFQLPADLAPGVYGFQVAVPNLSTHPGHGPVLLSNVEYIGVATPSSARFEIRSESLYARAETSPASFGSDEVGIRILALPLFPDLSSGEAQLFNGGEPIRFGDVDSGETRAMDHLLFSHQAPILGAALSIRGFEIDGEEAFERQIEDTLDAFIDILKDQLAFVMDHLKEAGSIASKLASYGLKGLIAAAIAAAVVVAIDVFVALWAPADPIIEDMIGPGVQDLVELTNVDVALPAASEHVTPQGIRVRVTPLDKIPGQYRERREYISDDEDSRYEIVFRYNRVA
ncbi:hypothetical protein [Massilia varians]|uniref:hypothetical protein n=1 Tax=Massilia varians TaxID=457921 RepID=UPI0025524BC8|nr:hypothetical protein [Massilia varians]MDK6076810.1 hypothetical protein [Massilia varians]